VRVRSGVSRVRVRVGSIGLGLVGLVLESEGFLWFGLGGNVREGKCPGGMSDTRVKRHEFFYVTFFSGSLLFLLAFCYNFMSGRLI